MLILSRKQGESVEFAELGVVVKVISLKKSKVQLGIEAPPQISVNRSEITADRQRNNGSADGPRTDGPRTDGPRTDGPRTDGPRADGLGDQRVLDHLAHIEGELAALAELASTKDRLFARQVAADSIQRLAGIRRTLRFATRHRSEARPISDFVKVRSEVLEHLRGDSLDEAESEHAVGWPVSESDPTSCVHQAPAGYAIVPSSPARACA